MASVAARKLAELVRPKSPQMTTAELAEKMAVSKQAVAKWLSGSLPSSKAMRELEDLLGIPMQDWFESAPDSSELEATDAAS